MHLARATNSHRMHAHVVEQEEVQFVHVANLHAVHVPVCQLARCHIMRIRLRVHVHMYMYHGMVRIFDRYILLYIYMYKYM